MLRNGVGSIVVNAQAKADEETLGVINTGKVYTPKALAQWVASLLIEAVSADKVFTVLDPACGDGELLLAVKEASKKKVKIFGTDIDSAAIKKISRKFPDGNFAQVDALLPKAKATIEAGWKEILPQKADILIANPPWGAGLVQGRERLLRAGYSLARGQFDSWDLFVELALKTVKKNGVIGFIVPDAVFLPEHEHLRRLLNTETTILNIARLGEGFFEGVARGTTVFVLRNAPCPKKHLVEVTRLNKHWRDSILEGKGTLTSARKALAHKIPQERFLKDAFSAWDIDTPEKEKILISSISSLCGEWTKWLEAGRGVELSKKGNVLECSNCAWVLPMPRKPREVQCVNCGHSVSSKDAVSIVQQGETSKNGWLPLIVGEDVDRYSAVPGRSIRASVAGINYKDAHVYEKRRILVRKTGVGIKASIVDAGPMINQVVYHYYSREGINVPTFYLSYVLGVMCSRIMFAYHLRRNGEVEWRSHPYLTQKIISRFPIPLPEEGNVSWKQAKAIASNVDKLLADGGRNEKTDMKIESLVAGLFRLKKSDMVWVHNVLDSAQDLEPMRVLKSEKLVNIEPIYA